MPIGPYGDYYEEYEEVSDLRDTYYERKKPEPKKPDWYDEAMLKQWQEKYKDMP